MIEILPSTDKEFIEFCNKVDSARESGFVGVHFGSFSVQGDPQAANDIADALVRRFGYQTLGDSWAEISQDTATAILISALETDLAYGEEVMSPGRAIAFIGEFLEFFRADSAPLRYLSNGNALGSDLRDASGQAILGYTTISDMMLDTGVCIVGTKHVGMIWVGDAD